MNVDDPGDLQESLGSMGNPALLADIRESLAECSIADVVVLTKDEARWLISG